MLWAVRLALLCYLLRLLVILRSPRGPRVPFQSECIYWALGCCCYLAHVGFAFHFEHGWSHPLAWEHTAAETHRLTGIRQGGGLWVNYLFTVVWIGDVIRLVRAYRSHRITSRLVDVTVQCSFAFIVFNATVVFGPSVYRWLAFPVIGALLWIRWQASRTWDRESIGD